MGGSKQHVHLKGAATAVKAAVKLGSGNSTFHAKPTKKLAPADLKTLIGFMDEDRCACACVCVCTQDRQQAHRIQSIHLFP